MSCQRKPGSDAVVEAQDQLHLDSQSLKEIMQKHHSVLMSTLYKQQVVLDELKRWSKDGWRPESPPPSPEPGPGYILGGGQLSEFPPILNPDQESASTSSKLLPPAQPEPEVASATSADVWMPSQVEAIAVEMSPKPRLAEQIQARTTRKREFFISPSTVVKLRHFVAGGALDLLAGVVILINAAVLIIEQEVRGHAAEAWLVSSLEGVPPPSKDRPTALQVIEYIFLAFYVAELVLRIAVLKKNWLYTEEGGLMWGNCFDALIVLFGVVDTLVSLALQESGQEPIFTILLIRLLRVVKVVKTMRLVRVMQLFGQLRGMLDTFLASLMALFWSMIMLLVCMMIAALVMCESCIPLLEELPLPTSEWVFNNYGSFSRSMYTMFEVTFSGGWPGLVRPLVEDVSVLFAFPCLLYVVLIVFAALRLITALLVRSTMQALSQDAATAVLERQERSAELQVKLQELFDDGDLNGDKSLTLQEWERLLEHREIVQYLSVLEVDVHDAKMLFHILDDGDGLLTVQEFCEGMPKVRGNAKSLDIIRLMHETGEIRRECESILQAIKTQSAFST